MKRTPLKRRTPLRAKKPWRPVRKPLPRVKPRRKEENRRYAKLKLLWHADPKNQLCQAVCQEIGIKMPSMPYPHHVKGRTGAMLLDRRYWLAICPGCHLWIEKNREAAWQRGWLSTRDAKAIRLENQHEH